MNTESQKQNKELEWNVRDKRNNSTLLNGIISMLSGTIRCKHYLFKNEVIFVYKSILNFVCILFQKYPVVTVQHTIRDEIRSLWSEMSSLAHSRVQRRTAAAVRLLCNQNDDEDELSGAHLSRRSHLLT